VAATCIHPWADICVNARGRVTCCTQNHTPLGQLPDDTPADAWNSPSAERVRALIRDGRYQEAGCERECPFLRNSFAPPLRTPPSTELASMTFVPDTVDLSTATGVASQKVLLFVTSNSGAAMPAGTTIDFETYNGTINSTDSFTVTAAGESVFTITLAREAVANGLVTAPLRVRVTSGGPNGTVTNGQIDVKDDG